MGKIKEFLKYLGSRPDFLIALSIGVFAIAYGTYGKFQFCGDVCDPPSSNPFLIALGILICLIAAFSLPWKTSKQKNVYYLFAGAVLIPAWIIEASISTNLWILVMIWPIVIIIFVAMIIFASIAAASKPKKDGPTE